MSELLFALFILLGFLSGTLFAGNLCFLVLIKLPKLIKRKLNSEVIVPIEEFINLIIPIVIWICVAIGLIYLISNYFNIYQKLFYSGIALSIIFCMHTLVTAYRKK